MERRTQISITRLFYAMYEKYSWSPNVLESTKYHTKDRLFLYESKNVIKFFVLLNMHLDIIVQRKPTRRTTYS